MRDPLVSIIIPTFRRPALLTRAIASVRSQTFTRWEILVVDDNDPGTSAREETRVLMQRYADEPRIRYLEHERNQGLPAARNTAIAAAAGPLVAFLDDDDEWLPEKLERQVAVLRARDDVALVYTGRRVVDGDGRLIRIMRADPLGLDRDALLEQNHVHTPSSVVCRRSALVEAGAFDERLPSLEDWDLYLRLSADHAFAFVDEQLTVYYHHDGGRMMEDYASLAAAYDILHDKHLHRFAPRRRAYAAFLRHHARVLHRAGDRRRARSTAWRSLRANALDRGALKLLLQIEMGEARVETLRRGTARLRGAVQRSDASSGS